jgi:hypothetical protein
MANAKAVPPADVDVPALVRAEVLRRLGMPDDLRGVQVRPLWDNHYRVNVLVGPDAGSARVAHCFFVTADPHGAVVASEPEIRRHYTRPAAPTAAAEGGPP